MTVVADWFNANIVFIGAGFFLALLLIFLLLFSLSYRLGRLTKAHKSLMAGSTGVDLEKLLESYLTKVQSAEARVKELDLLCRKLEEYAKKSLQNTSLIRFNAFNDMGSDLSFAAALLDLSGDGLVLSSINSREESRVYAKPIKAQKSSYHLSGEELEAIKQAMAKSKN